MRERERKKAGYMVRLKLRNCKFCPDTVMVLNRSLASSLFKELI